MKETNDNGESKYSELKEALNPLGVHTDYDGAILFIYYDEENEDEIIDILSQTEHVYLKEGEAGIDGYDKEIWIDEDVIVTYPDENEDSSNGDNYGG